MGLLKVSQMRALSGTPMAPSEGPTSRTLGGMGASPAPVVNAKVYAAGSWTPAAERADAAIVMA